MKFRCTKKNPSEFSEPALNTKKSTKPLNYLITLHKKVK